MPNNMTSVLQQSFKDFAVAMNSIMDECADIDKAYFATDASTLVGGLANSTDAASYATKLTKATYINGITFVEQLKNFFNNSAVSTADYLGTIDQILYANAASPIQLSPAAEALADRIYAIAQLALEQYTISKTIINNYNASQLSILVGGATSVLVIYGADMNLSQLIQGITLVQQFNNLINNQAVSTGLYSTNVGVWLNL